MVLFGHDFTQLFKVAPDADAAAADAVNSAGSAVNWTPACPVLYSRSATAMLTHRKNVYCYNSI